MARERDLFRAIVLSAVALVGTSGCGDGESAVTDAGARDAAAADASGDVDAGAMVADASTAVDAAVDDDASAELDGGDAMVLII